MALLAIRAEIIIMRIGMASIAIAGFYSGKHLEVLTVPGFFLVAFGTIHRFVLP